MLNRNLSFTCLIGSLCCGIAFSQEGGRPVQGRPTPSLLRATSANGETPDSDKKTNKFAASAMSHLAVLTPVNPMPGVNERNSALGDVLRKQSFVAQSLLNSVPSLARKDGGSTLFNGGSGQVMNARLAPGTSAPQPSNTQLDNPSGPVRSGVSNPRSVASARVQPSMTGTNVVPSQACVLGIGAVDGQKSGGWFSPVAGTDGMFVIQGCGFGTTPGQVYLSGLHYAPSSIPGASLRSQRGSDQIAFQVSPGKWSDRQIVAQIDANASGFYDTTDVTLAVRTSNGQLYQAAGFNFSAARAPQLLTAILKAPTCWSSQNGCVPSGINLALVNSANGEVQADAESPSVSLMNPGETIAVARQNMASQFPIPAAPGLSFPGASDVYQFHFAPGFQLDPHSAVQLQHTTLNNSYCQS